MTRCSAYPLQVILSLFQKSTHKFTLDFFFFFFDFLPFFFFNSFSLSFGDKISPSRQSENDLGVPSEYFPKRRVWTFSSVANSIAVLIAAVIIGSLDAIGNHPPLTLIFLLITLDLLYSIEVRINSVAIYLCTFILLKSIIYQYNYVKK